MPSLLCVRLCYPQAEDIKKMGGGIAEALWVCACGGEQILVGMPGAMLPEDFEEARQFEEGKTFATAA